MAQEKIAGTQSIERAFSILRTLARGGTRGMPLREIARWSGLTSATVHRMLRQLVQQDAVVQHANSDYALGPLMSELSVSSYPRQLVVATCRPSLDMLATATGETVFLHFQSGADSICLDRIDGTGIVRVITLEVGERRPLSDSAAGTAILAALADEEADALVARAGAERARYPSSPEAVMERVRGTRQRGYAFIQRDEVGVSAIGMAVPARGAGLLAISLSSTSAQLTEPRLSIVRDALRAAVLDAAERLSGSAGLVAVR